MGPLGLHLRVIARRFLCFTNKDKNLTKRKRKAILEEVAIAFQLILPRGSHNTVDIIPCEDPLLVVLGYFER